LCPDKVAFRKLGKDVGVGQGKGLFPVCRRITKEEGRGVNAPKREGNVAAKLNAKPRPSSCIKGCQGGGRNDFKKSLVATKESSGTSPVVRKKKGKCQDNQHQTRSR